MWSVSRYETRWRRAWRSRWPRGQTGCLIGDANAKLAQRRGELTCSGRRERLNPHTDLREIFRGRFDIKTVGRPIAGCYAVNQVCGNNKAPVDQAFQSFFDLGRREFTGKRADQDFAALSGSNARSKRAIEFAAKEDLAVLRVQADDIGRQDV